MRSSAASAGAFGCVMPPNRDRDRPSQATPPATRPACRGRLDPAAKARPPSARGGPRSSPSKPRRLLVGRSVPPLLSDLRQRRDVGRRLVRRPCSVGALPSRDGRGALDAESEAGILPRRTPAHSRGRTHMAPTRGCESAGRTLVLLPAGGTQRLDCGPFKLTLSFADHMVSVPGRKSSVKTMWSAHRPTVCPEFAQWRDSRRNRSARKYRDSWRSGG
jgi:hypothetical protein